MHPYLSILRPGNCLMSVVASLVGSFIILKTLAPISIIAAAIVFLITGAGNVINDYVDIEADKINRPKRPIPSGKIKPKSAIFYASALFILGVSLSMFTTAMAFSIAVFNTLLLILYSAKLKNKIYIGNAVVSYLVGSTILFGSAAVLTSFQPSLLMLPSILMLLSGLSNFSREIVKTLEDIEGDKFAFIKKIVKAAKQKVLEKFRLEKGEVKTNFNEGLAAKAAAMSLFLVIIISPIPYIFRLLGIGYIILLVPTALIFLKSIALILSKKRKYSRISRLIKIGMFMGLLAYVAGILV